jgi:hypothetical protein
MPPAALVDNRYDAEANRTIARARGITPRSPTRRIRIYPPAYLRTAPSRGQARIESTVGKLMRFEPIAWHRAKNAEPICRSGFSFILISSVNTA